MRNERVAAAGTKAYLALKLMDKTQILKLNQVIQCSYWALCSHCTHHLSSHCALTALTIYPHTVLSLRSYCARCSHYNHTVLSLHSHCAHCSYCSHHLTILLSLHDRHTVLSLTVLTLCPAHTQPCTNGCVSTAGLRDSRARGSPHDVQQNTIRRAAVRATRRQMRAVCVSQVLVC